MTSHRSGETEDNYIADLAVGLCTGQIKTGKYFLAIDWITTSTVLVSLLIRCRQTPIHIISYILYHILSSPTFSSHTLSIQVHLADLNVLPNTINYFVLKRNLVPKHHTLARATEHPNGWANKQTDKR